MLRAGSDVTALVGLDEFVITGGWLLGGQWTLWIEPRPLGPVGCPACGTKAWRHDRRRHVVRDLPISGVPVRLIWRKQLWRCPDSDCAVASFADASHEIDERAVLTERARTHIARRVAPGGQSVAALAGEFGVSWWAAMDAVRDHARAPGRPCDRARRATGGRPRRDVVPGCHADVADEVRHPRREPRHRRHHRRARRPLQDRRVRLARVQAQVWRDGIEHVVIDPHQPYAAAVRRWLPDAAIIVDHFPPDPPRQPGARRGPTPRATRHPRPPWSRR